MNMSLGRCFVDKSVIPICDITVSASESIYRPHFFSKPIRHTDTLSPLFIPHIAHDGSQDGHENRTRHAPEEEDLGVLLHGNRLLNRPP
jgi:hypothetical protein